MRGLDTRILWAHARIAAAIAGNADDAEINDQRIDVLYQARADGAIDGAAGLFEPPLMFAGEPELLAWWNDGNAFAAELAEMRECSGCNDGTGNPCCIHG